MQINGIIAEYNPFHNGHKYQLTNAKEQTGATYTIIAMSGNFMQRGVPALLDKYKRAEMALRNGADLVLELPSYYSASSAEYFAIGAVTLLDRLGVVNHLCFGSECGEIEILERLADILLTEPTQYTELLRQYLREGLSYPVARTAALLDYAPSLSAYRDVLSSPNNILGIEYIKALHRRNSQIKPFTTLRIGSDYHDIRLGINQSSAKAIRQTIAVGGHLSCLQTQVPENVYQLILDSMEQSGLVFPQNLSSVLHYKLLQEHATGYEHFLDVSSELSDRICNNLYKFTDYNSFCNLLKTKEMTYTRVSRCLLHILLDMTKETMQGYKEMDYMPYARVLGFRRESTPLLAAIKKNTSIPLITKLADAEKLLASDAYAMLQEELRINKIYQSIVVAQTGIPMENELSTPIVIV